MKTKIKIIVIPQYHSSDCVVGDVGYIDGYCRGADDIPYVMIVIPRTKKLIMAMPYHFEIVINSTQGE